MGDRISCIKHIFAACILIWMSHHIREFVGRQGFPLSGLISFFEAYTSRYILDSYEIHQHYPLYPLPFCKSLFIRHSLPVVGSNWFGVLKAQQHVYKWAICV